MQASTQINTNKILNLNTKSNISQKTDFLRTEFNKYKTAADFVAFKFVQEKTREYSVRNIKIDDMSEFNDSGLLIEIMSNGHIGYGATSELTSEGVKNCFAKAKAQTLEFSKNSVFKFPLTVRPLATGSYHTPSKNKLDQMGMASLIDYLKQTSQALKVNDKIIAAVSDAMIIQCVQYYISSIGSEFLQEFDIVTHSMSATASDGKESQTRSLHGGRANCVQAGSEELDVIAAKAKAESIGEEALALLNAENCPTETCDLILAPDQMLLQIHESIGHPLELDRILGDERNFAGWSFVKPQDFGSLQYGSSLMNVVFDPTTPNELASYKFDETGNHAEKKYLIEGGVLKAGLGSLESQTRSGLNGVANARSSSWNRAPIDRMANINLEGGNQTLDELISKVENGVIMFANRSWSIDDYRRKFQFGCELAYKIKDGKKAQLLKNPNYRGVTVPFWNSLAGLTSTDSVETYGSPYCGKGEPSQVIRVGHSSPYALFRNIEVFGGG